MGLQREFQAAGNKKFLDLPGLDASGPETSDEAAVALLHDIGMPVGLNKGDAGGLELIHSIVLVTDELESGRTVGRRPWTGERLVPFSIIRTVTVGFGFTPNLLTLPRCGRRSRA